MTTILGNKRLLVYFFFYILLAIAAYGYRQTQYILLIFSYFPARLFTYKEPLLIHEKYASKLQILYLLIFVYSLVVYTLRSATPLFHLFSFSFFLLTPLPVALRAVKIFDLKVFMKGLFVCYVFTYLLNLINRGANLSFDFLKRFLLTSVCPTEDFLGLTFPFFVYFFYVNKNVLFTMLALVATVFSYKRISIGALIVILLLDFVLNRKLFQKMNSSIVSFVLVIVNLILILAYKLITDGVLDNIIYQLTSFDTNIFFAGRQNLYSVIFYRLGEIPFLGHGIGYTSVALDGTFVLSIIIQNIFDFGILFFTLWIFLLYKYVIKIKEAFLLTIFVNIIFLTDNIFYYFEIMFIYYSMILFWLFQTANQKNWS